MVSLIQIVIYNFTYYKKYLDTKRNKKKSNLIYKTLVNGGLEKRSDHIRSIIFIRNFILLCKRLFS